VPVFFVTVNMHRFRNRHWDEAALALAHYYYASFFFNDCGSMLLFFAIGACMRLMQ
jgi:hypothetical protein